MSLECMNPAPLLANHLVGTDTFVDHPLQMVDVGARFGFEPFWEAVFKQQVRLLGFESDVDRRGRHTVSRSPRQLDERRHP